MPVFSDAPDAFLSPVKDHDDIFAFRYGFELDGKALDDDGTDGLVTELDNGDLLIQGWAAVFEGVDREGENFAPGAFERGIKSFLSGNAPLCFHHKNDIVLGKVLDLREVPDKGLYMRARVDAQPESSPHRWLYNGVKKGSISGLSVGGFFKRKLVEGGPKIVDMDFTEVSMTGVPVHPGTSFAVVAGKALSYSPDATDPAGDPVEPVFEEPSQEELNALSEALDRLASTFGGKALPKSHDPGEAGLLADFIDRVQRLRQLATSLQSITENSDLSSLGDACETALVSVEADAHKLAAKIGPLPPTSNY